MASATSQLLKSSSKYLPAIATQLVIAVSLAIVPLQAKAATFLVTDRAALGANDQVDWSSVSPPFAPLPNDFRATSQGGLGLSVNIPPVNPENPLISAPFVFQTSSTGIRTNFANGDYILFGGIDVRGFGPNPPFPTDGNGGPFTITFDRPVFGAGTQIATDDVFGFDTFVSAFDSNNNLLGTFSTPGTSSLALDNSAAFIGVRSDTANISSLVFSTSDPQRGLAINRLSVIAVPEANSTLGILVFGASGAVLKLRRRK
ncbi:MULTISPECIES: hypothetical protein [unclassified Nostoc]|uniref:hypothetical protein n=1 Tax=unclassified Nostoc TaxID=2593658 RepID=UPI002AD1D8B7|nr:hypothetical protein [Nostoc sp. DedQUE03]MDZ7975925.1 hypothetical protein [Nostoc sp. DedQUE03]MDZ8044760.1 hypothetical protein [Nostoc sp. DedQUE02]